MKVTITSKGDGFIDLHLEAETNLETLVMSVCGNEGPSGCSISLDSSRGRPKIQIGYLSINALEILHDKRS